MADRARPRRFIEGSPFNKPSKPEPPAEEYAVQDRVTHDRYGLGRVLALEDETSLIVDFGSRVTRIRLPCTRMTKL
jgi:hypothetical protein